MNKKEELPFVSVIVPIKNEVAYTIECLNSLLNQDYPFDKYEIVIIADSQEDPIVKTICDFQRKYAPRVNLLFNEEAGVSGARRTGVKKARGEVIIDFSAHASAEKNFISCLTKTLMACKRNVGAVGCKHTANVNDPLMARAIFTAMTSFFGGSGTAEHCPSEESFVDATLYTAYWKNVIEDVGGYPLGGDSELHIRVKEAGYKHYFTPHTTAYFHWKRHHISNFLKRMFKYGYIRARHLKDCPRFFNMVYTFPSILVTLFVLALASYVFVPNAFVTKLFLFLVTTYFIAGTLSSIVACLRSKCVVMLPLVFVSYIIIHFGYGIGFIYGSLKCDHRTQKSE